MLFKTRLNSPLIGVTVGMDLGCILAISCWRSCSSSTAAWRTRGTEMNMFIICSSTKEKFCTQPNKNKKRLWCHSSGHYPQHLTPSEGASTLIKVMALLSYSDSHSTPYRTHYADSSVTPTPLSLICERDTLKLSTWGSNLFPHQSGFFHPFPPRSSSRKYFNWEFFTLLPFSVAPKDRVHPWHGNRPERATNNNSQSVNTFCDCKMFSVWSCCVAKKLQKHLSCHIPLQ